MIVQQNSLKICFWNARALKNKLIETFNFLITENIDVLLVNETWLKSTDSVLKNSNYKCYRLDRLDKSGGGVCIFIKKTIKHTLLPWLNTNVIESIGINIQNNSSSFNLIGCYFSRQKINPNILMLFRRDIRLLTHYNNSDVFICGDLNARHRFWGCSKANKTGNVLYEELTKNYFSLVFPSTHTFFPSSRKCIPSTLDLLLTNKPHSVTSIATSDDLASDHLPVICHIDYEISLNPETKLEYDYNKADWQKFRNIICEQLNLNSSTMAEITSWNVIDQKINFLIKVIHSAELEAIPKQRINQSYNDLQLNDEIKTLIKIKNSARRTFQRHRNSAFKIYYKILKSTIEEKIIELRNERWNTLLSNFQDTSPQFWKITKLIKNRQRFLPPLRSNNKLIITDSEKSDCIAQQFHNSHMISNDLSDAATREEVKSTVNCISTLTIDLSGIRLIKPNELKCIVKNLKNKKSPGIDGISNRVLKKCPNTVFIFLTYIFNKCLKLSYFPLIWKTAIIVPIPKPNKDCSLPHNYRPISLLNSFSKIFECALLDRLKEHLLQNDILPCQQFGFRSGHSTNHQVLRLVKNIRENHNLKLSSGIILLDIEKAFDSVWHEGLLYKLHKINLPTYLTKIVMSYLTNRSFKVKINDSFSKLFSIPAGVPQGAVLSPTLYNIFMYDLPHPRECSLYMYADDSAIMAQSLNPNIILRNLESGIKDLKQYFDKWKIKLNIQKSQAAFFTRRRKSCFLPNRQISVEGLNIPWENTLKYLGIILDKNVTFSPHINYLIQKCSNNIRILYPFINRKSRLSKTNKLIIYKTIFRQLLTFGAPIWRNCAKSHISRLQITQNKILKMIYNLPLFFRTSELHSISKIDYIKDFIDKIYIKFRNKLEYALNPLISAL